MTNRELGEEIEVIVKDLCKFGGRQDKYALEVVDEIKKRLEILEILKKHIYFSSKSGCIRMKDIYKSIKNFDYEELREWLDNDN